MDASPEVEELFDDANGDLALGELESAVTKYARCTELAPEFFDAWHALGMALMKVGRYPEAIAAARPVFTPVFRTSFWRFYSRPVAQ